MIDGTSARRRLAAAGAVVALVVASLLGGALASQAAPGSPEIVSPADGEQVLYTTDPLTFTATDAIATTSAYVYVDDEEYCGYPSMAVDGGWSCSGVLALALGDHSAYAVVDGAVGPVITFTVYAEPSIQIDGSLAGSVQLGDDVEVFGTAAVGVTDVYVTDSLGDTCSSAVVDGEWSCAVTPSATTQTYTVDASDSPTGGAIASATMSVLLPPTVDKMYEQDSPGYYTVPSYLDPAVITGTGAEGASIHIVLSLYPEPDITCDTVVSDGIWSCDLGSLSDEVDYELYVTQSLWGATSHDAGYPGYVYLDQSTATEPTLNCSFTPGGLTVSGSPTRVEFYRVTSTEGGGSPELPGTCSGPSEQITDPIGYTYVGYCDATEDDDPGAPYLGDVADGSCAITLSEGTYDLYYPSTEGNAYFDYFFTVYPSPKTFAATSQASTVTFTGDGTPGSTARVVDSSGATLCSTTVGAGGTWSCVYTGRASTISTPVRAFLVQPGTGARSNAAQLSTLPPAPAAPFVPPTTPSPTATPSPTPTPRPTSTATPVWNPATFVWTFSADADGYHPGDPVTLSGAGLPPAALVRAEIHSTPAYLGTTIARQNGTFILNVSIPADTPAGTHKFVVTITPLNGTDSTVVQPAKITVLGAPGDEGGLPAVPAGYEGDPRNLDTWPSAITSAIPTLLDVLTSPATIGLAVGLALVILLLVALPTEVLNATIESNTGRFGGVFAAIQSAVDRATEWFIAATRTPLVATAILLLTTSTIFGFVDPGFGIDLTSLRLVLSLTLALFIVTYVASVVTGRIVQKRWSLTWSIGMQPTALVFAVVGVIVARLLDFSPGFLVGLIIGLELAEETTDRQRVRTSIVKYGVIVAFALTAWIGYSVWIAVQGGGVANFADGLFQDALVAVTSEGLTAAMVAILPLGFLDGRAIFQHNKKLWAITFVFVATAFALLVLPSAVAGQEIGDVASWVAVLIGFAALTLGATVVLRRVASRVTTTPKAKVDA